MSYFSYSQLIENALRGMVRDVLDEVAEAGLPGDHRILLTFKTQYPGVELPSSLRAQYPEEMTVILQHQFRDLEVDDEAFSVFLHFSGVEHGITVPFQALRAFADPSENFSLQFRHFSEVELDVEEEPVEELPLDEDEGPAKVLPFGAPKKGSR